MADGIGVPNLVLAQLAVGIPVAKVKRLATGWPDFQDEALDGCVVVVHLPFLGWTDRLFYELGAE
jgi:hypothetical protein